MVRDPATDEMPGRVSPGFVKLASICAFGTVLTTLVVHWVPRLWEEANSFDAQVKLQHNPIYMARLWIVLLHCVLVVISMAAIPGLLAGKSRLIALFGFGSYIMFAFVETLRTSLSIFAVNRAWRAGYEVATDESKRTAFRNAIESFSGINDALFFLFDLAFLLGLICYGLALLNDNGSDQRIAWLFLIWGVLTFPAVLAAAVGNNSLAAPFDWVGPYFLPLARFVVGVWLWTLAGQSLPSTINHQPSPS
jgi:hypothetical protein